MKKFVISFLSTDFQSLLEPSVRLKWPGFDLCSLIIVKNVNLNTNEILIK